MYKSILFDMDGLMIDSETIYITYFTKKLAELGYSLTEDMFKGQMGLGIPEEADYFIKCFNINRTTEEMVRFLDTEGMQANIIKNNERLETMPGLFELISHFKGRLSYAIATGSSTPFRDFVVQQLGLADTFSVFVSAEEVQKGKPNPDIYLEAAYRLGSDIGQCIVLEDAPAGVIAGKTAGAFVIAVPNEWSKDHTFDQADVICSSLFEARDLIDRLIHQ
ncbi:MAG: HAD family hydrolase [Brevinema sp.]